MMHHAGQVLGEGLPLLYRPEAKVFIHNAHDQQDVQEAR
jgi:hypothetical protein